MDMSFNEAVNLYRDIVRLFEKIEGRDWGAEGAVMELAKQVGELTKYVMLKEKCYFFSADDSEIINNIQDELADVFGQIIRIADYYEIDLLKAHVEARKGEIRCLEENGV